MARRGLKGFFSSRLQRRRDSVERRWSYTRGKTGYEMDTFFLDPEGQVNHRRVRDILVTRDFCHGGA